MKGKVFKVIVLVVLTMLVIAGGANASGLSEIPWAGPTSLPDYIGAPAKAHPTANNGVPQNPYLATNGLADAHMDIWMSDTTNFAGPLGRDPVTLSTNLPDLHKYSSLTPCGNIMFDSHNRLILTCFGANEAYVAMLDPDTLEVLTHYDLEVETGDPYGEGAQKILPSTYAIYGYLDNRDQLLLVEHSRKIIKLRDVGTLSSPEFKIIEEESFDLGQLVDETNDRISGVMVDFQGRYWINMGKSAHIYMLNPATYHGIGDLKSVYLDYDGDGDEFTRNGLALTEEGAAYIVTTEAMYRVDASTGDQLQIVWSVPYDTAPETTNNEEYVNGVRSGQLERGSGTTPTILGEGKYVAITDNAEQLQVVVYRTATDEELGPDQQRIVCTVPVFDFPGGGKGANSNSLIGLHNSIIVQNTYGYLYDFDEANNYENPHLEPPGGALGIERIDINPNGKDCTKVWVDNEVATVLVPRLSTRTGLIYTQDRKWDDKNKVNAYYWVALDFRTGKVVWEKLAGTGDMYENWWLAPIIGRNGALYGPVYGGVTMIRDTP
jgi:hypothetical protein